jgi:hypothetical protein
LREKARQIKEREREMREERKAELEVRAGGDLNMIKVSSLLQDFFVWALGATLTNTHIVLIFVHASPVVLDYLKSLEDLRKF